MNVDQAELPAQRGLHRPRLRRPVGRRRPVTGLDVYDDGNWGLVGGTSLATPLIAAYYAITGVDDTGQQHARQVGLHRRQLVAQRHHLRLERRPAPPTSLHLHAGAGYDGPTGVGLDLRRVIATGAPGIGGPSIGRSTRRSGRHVHPDSAGVHAPRRHDRRRHLSKRAEHDLVDPVRHDERVTASQTPAADIGVGHAPVIVTGYPTDLAPAPPTTTELVAQNSDGTTDGYDVQLHHRGRQSTTAPVAAFTSSPARCHAWVVGHVSTRAARPTRARRSPTTAGTSATAPPSTTPAPRPTPTATPSRGTYNVTLTVTNSNGESETTTQTVTVDRLRPRRSLSPAQPTPGTATTFDASGSTDSVGTITDYSWNFGDGSPVDDTGSTADRNPHLRHARHLHRHADRHERCRTDRDLPPHDHRRRPADGQHQPRQRRSPPPARP